MFKTNATMLSKTEGYLKDPCSNCKDEHKLPSDNPCSSCARNNLSGYYEDFYVNKD